MTPHPDIIQATISDSRALSEVSRQTFADTFAEANTAENIHDYLETHLSEDAIAGQLSEPGTHFYLAKLDNRIVGYLKLNSGTAQTELKDHKTLEVERIYIVREFQCKGFGRLLMGKAMDIAKQQQVNYLWLGVWEHNPGAIRFYRSLGFVEFNRHVFMLGTDKQTDIMMKLESQKLINTY